MKLSPQETYNMCLFLEILDLTLFHHYRIINNSCIVRPYCHPVIIVTRIHAQRRRHSNIVCISLALLPTLPSSSPPPFIRPHSDEHTIRLTAVSSAVSCHPSPKPTHTHNKQTHTLSLVPSLNYIRIIYRFDLSLYHQHDHQARPSSPSVIQLLLNAMVCWLAAGWNMSRQAARGSTSERVIISIYSGDKRRDVCVGCDWKLNIMICCSSSDLSVSLGSDRMSCSNTQTSETRHLTWNNTNPVIKSSWR